jgi:hypothetical protein
MEMFSNAQLYRRKMEFYGIFEEQDAVLRKITSLSMGTERSLRSDVKFRAVRWENIKQR